MERVTHPLRTQERPRSGPASDLLSASLCNLRPAICVYTNDHCPLHSYALLRSFAGPAG